MSDYDPFEYDPRGYDDFDPNTDYGFPVGDRDPDRERGYRYTIHRVPGDTPASDLPGALGEPLAVAATQANARHTAQRLQRDTPAGHVVIIWDTAAGMPLSWYDGAGDLQAIRSDLVTARLTIRRAIAGDDADLEAAAGYIDATLAGLCPHDPATHHHTTADSGEELTTCTACNVSWYTGRRYGEGQS